MPSKEFFLARARELRHDHLILTSKIQGYNKKALGLQLEFIQGLIEVNMYFAQAAR